VKVKSLKFNQRVKFKVHFKSQAVVFETSHFLQIVAVLTV